MAEIPTDTSTLSLKDCHDADVLTRLLSLLFEPTDTLRTLLVPSVLLRLTARNEPPSSYDELISICEQVADEWTWQQKGDFLAGHPMIGEVKVKGLSGKEQGGGPKTPEVVLRRLAHLNTLYCKIYPGLRYITFVNGRSRAQIIPEFESILGLLPSPEPIPDTYPVDQPAIDSEQVDGMVKSPSTEEWKRECERGLGDIWRIGRSRLGSLGLE